jgi:hypothetical protein
MAEPSCKSRIARSVRPDGGDGWSIFTWFGGGNSAEDSSGNPGDAARPADNERFDLLQQRFLDSFQVG